MSTTLSLIRNLGKRPQKIYSENEELIMDKDGSVSMNYENETVRKNIQDQIKRFSKIRVESDITRQPEEG